MVVCSAKGVSPLKYVSNLLQKYEGVKYIVPLTKLQAGWCVRRAAWRESDYVYLGALTGQEEFANCIVHVCDGTYEPWAPRHADLLASDWVIEDE
jgi:Protein of unknown function (DUF2829)